MVPMRYIRPGKFETRARGDLSQPIFPERQSCYTMGTASVGSLESEPMSRNIACTRVEGLAFSPGFHDVAEEVPVSVSVNGRQILVAMTSPTLIREYVVGFLFTEGIVTGIDEIESIRVEGHRVSVLTKNPFRMIGGKRTILSGCGGASSFLDPEKLPRITAALEISPSTVHWALKDILSSDLHRRTGGVHIVGMFRGNSEVTVAEDIGRHNALDRVVGWGLLQSIDFSSVFVVCSGRISSEMVRKCSMAGIPLIASRGATTTLAVGIAEKTGITLIGFVRGEHMNIYSHAERVLATGIRE